MTDSIKKFPGSKWWKFDFHTHTPASKDYGKGQNHDTFKQVTQREWLLGYMRKGIDCVAVTDHNSGEWIDLLKEEYKRIKEEGHSGFRELHIFPGVELTVNGGLHLLAVFDLNKSTGDITRLLGAVGYRGKPGGTEECTEKSLVETVKEITSHGGLAIPAHVDEPRGIFKGTSGTTLKQILKCQQIFAMEVVDANNRKPPLYKDHKLNWTELLGSDAHYAYEDSSYPVNRFTWVKMGTPNLEGLRLALLDGSPLSVRRGDQFKGEPNRYASRIIKELIIEKARYCGRKEPFRIEFNPWLNAIIGGRGVGKSTVVEFLRIASRRDNELPGKIVETFNEFKRTPKNRDERGMLTEETVVRMVYRKDGHNYRIQWSQDGKLEPIQSSQGENWEPEEGDIQQRFPVRIYSQKQIFEMVESPKALLQVINEAAEVNAREWEEKWNREKSRFLSLRAQIREWEARIKEKDVMIGQLKDIDQKLKVFESYGHAQLLENYRQRKRQDKAVIVYRQSIEEIIELLKNTKKSLVLENFQSPLFNKEDKAENTILEVVNSTQQEIKEIRLELHELTKKAEAVLTMWDTAVKGDKSLWQQEFLDTMNEYEDLGKRLKKENVHDPSEYGHYVQDRQVLEQKLKNLESLRRTKDKLEKQAKESLERIDQLREELSSRRRDFLENVLENNPLVKIQLMPCGDKVSLEKDFRKVINREESGLQENILSEDGNKGILSDINKKFSKEKLLQLKNNVIAAAKGNAVPEAAEMGKWFLKHLQRLQPETLDHIECWYPDDGLKITYSQTSDRRKFKPIEQGSPGQKTAALLAFLLSYGAEPMILDQPEDDLDNHLIYDLVVTQLRENKIKRQLIVVTHNPNIVVNGDAELVLALDYQKGQSIITHQGSLQENNLREEICRVMEGGREAFARRYRRMITGGTKDV